MKELHGIADADMIATVNTKGRSTVEIIDGKDGVILRVDHATYPVLLSPERARFIAKMIVQSAQRIEAAVRQ